MQTPCRHMILRFCKPFGHCCNQPWQPGVPLAQTASPFYPNLSSLFATALKHTKIFADGTKARMPLWNEPTPLMFITHPVSRQPASIVFLGSFFPHQYVFFCETQFGSAGIQPPPFMGEASPSFQPAQNSSPAPPPSPLDEAPSASGSC